MHDYIPSREADLLSWSSNFSAKITADPAAYGLSVQDATDLEPLVAAYASTYQTASDPHTRTPVAIANKRSAKAALIAHLRTLARRIQPNLQVTAAQRTQLGLPVRDRVLSPVPAPSDKPLLELCSEDVCRHTVRLLNEAHPTQRAQPRGTIGAQIFTYIADHGEAPPQDLEQWTLHGLATRSRFELTYHSRDVGKKAWIAARWFNLKGQVGPRSDAVARMIAA
jgi:hypothetical protein